MLRPVLASRVTCPAPYTHLCPRTIRADSPTPRQISRGTAPSAGNSAPTRHSRPGAHSVERPTADAWKGCNAGRSSRDKADHAAESQTDAQADLHGPSLAAAAAVRALHETWIADKYGSREAAIDFVLNLSGWRAIEDRLAAAGYERSAAITWALSPNGWLPGDATPADALDGLEEALRSAASPGEWARRHD